KTDPAAGEPDSRDSTRRVPTGAEEPRERGAGASPSDRKADTTERTPKRRRRKPPPQPKRAWAIGASVGGLLAGAVGAAIYVGTEDANVVTTVMDGATDAGSAATHPAPVDAGEDGPSEQQLLE